MVILKKTKISGIYTITNVVNGRVYVGSAIDINKRWSTHKSNLKNNKRNNKYLQEDYNNQSVNDFVYEIVEECLQRDLLVKEKKWKDFFGDKVYNINGIHKKKKKIRRGKEAKNFKKNCHDTFSGDKNPNCQEEIDIIIQIKIAIRDGLKNKDIAKMFNKRGPYISQIKTGYRWSDIEIPTDYELFAYKENRLETVGAVSSPEDKDNVIFNSSIPQNQSLETSLNQVCNL